MMSEPSAPPLECPEGKAPGWLDEDGEPTSCVDDNPGPGPVPPPVDPECPGTDTECDAGDRCATVVDCFDEDPTPEPAPTQDPTPDPDQTPTPWDDVAPPEDELPQTGVGDAIVWALVVIGLLATGAALVEHARRRRDGLR